MYGELFNDAADEAELSTFLVSPTRQAVALARAYNSKERKLQISSTSRPDDLYEDEDEDETPAFIQVIEQQREEADNRGLLTKVTRSRSVWSNVPSGLDPEIPFTPEIKAEEAGETEEPSSPKASEAEIEYVVPDYTELKFDDIPPISVRDVEEKAPENKPETETVPENIFDDDETDTNLGGLRRQEEEPERKIIVPLAVLFAIIAIPLTVILVCVLLVPTFASLGVSAGCLYVGAKVTMAAFAGFSMFSDIMVVLGSGVIILALGLLFLWLFIWFIGGAVAGLINAVIRLGGKWCSKEVR